MNGILEDIVRRLDEYQTGVNPPDSDFIEEVNSIAKDLLIECPNCKLPLLGIGSIQHIKYCDGIPIMGKYRPGKQKKKPIEETIMYKKRRGYKKTLIKALNESTTIEEYESTIKDGGFSVETGARYLKEFNLKDLKDKKWEEWIQIHRRENNKIYWTTTNCDYCGKEFDIRKIHFKNKDDIYNDRHHCNRDCYNKNKSNIAQTILDEKFAKMGVEWVKVKAHKLEHMREYRRLVTAWAVYNLRLHNPEMFKEWKNPDNDYQLDHKWAVIHAFHRGIDPQLISHIDNLQLLHQFENGSKSDDWIDEIIPDVLREASEQPIDLSRYNRLNPPHIPKVPVPPDSECIQCNKEYFEHKSNADVPEKYCGVTCEKKAWLTPDREKMLYDLLKERILSLDWKIITDITKPIGDMYGTYMIGGRDIIRDIFYDIWKDEFNLPTDGVKGTLERKLVECNKDYSFPESYHGPFKLKCVECGDIIITKWRVQLHRWYGLDAEKKKNTIEVCQSCGMKRQRGIARGGWNARKEKLAKMYGGKWSKWM